MMRNALRNRRRSGAVLILVIVLLVLMALMGISYMATARTDRASAANNVSNTQTEILLDGLLKLVQAKITDDLFDGNAYRKPRPTAWNRSSVPYQHLDHPATDTDKYLASRVPMRLADLAVPFESGAFYERGAVVVDLSGAGGPAYYVRQSAGAGGSLSDAAWQLIGQGAAAGNIVAWEWFSNLDMPFGTPDPGNPGTIQPQGTIAIPDAKALPNGRVYPAVRLPGVSTPFVAADADGDGIADALLFPIPGAKFGGITYYGAVRVIDHNSAINASVALGQANPLSPADYFPSALNLQGMLSSADANRLYPAIVPSAVDSPYDTASERLWMHLGRVLPSSALAPSALAPTDMSALAYRFVIRRPVSSPDRATRTERLLEDALGNAPQRTYAPNDISRWFSENFDFDSGALRSARALLVTRNGVLNASPVKSIVTGVAAAPVNTASVGEIMQDYHGVAVRASVNTAGFAELWRQYWNVIVEDPIASRPHSIGGKLLRQFREMARWPRGIHGSVFGASVPESHRALLRAALAAVNTIDLRDVDQDITTRKFSYNDPATGVSYVYRVYGNEPQPFITEVVFYRDAAASPTNYIGIELYNPTESTITMTNWRLAVMDRTNQTTITDANGNTLAVAAPLELELIDHPPLDTTPMVPGGYKVIQSRVEPTVGGSDSATDTVLVPDLDRAIGKELVLLRPISAGVPALPQTGKLTTAQLDNYAPIDQFDMTEWTDKFDPQTAGFGEWFHYMRNTAGWFCSFAGRYSPHRPGNSGNPAPGEGGDTFERPDPEDPAFETQPLAPRRYEGIDENGSRTVPVATLGGPHGPMPKATVSFSIPLNSIGHIGPTGGYPRGGFARDGDILNVPFIGAYRFEVHPPAAGGGMFPPLEDGQFWELNSIAMDAAMADDADELNGASGSDNNGVEAVGRFVPLYNTPSYNNQWDENYAWATDLFDYLGVIAPQTDQVPEGPRENNPSARPKQSLPDSPVGRPGYDARNAGFSQFAQGLNPPAAWLEDWNAAEREGRVPTEGLVNINTAPWRVIAALPLLPPSAAGPDSNGNGVPDMTEALAKAIVKFRSQNGPYRTIFDLNRVPSYPMEYLGLDPARAGRPMSPAFWTALSDLSVTDDDEKGYFRADSQRPQFVEDHLMLTRISNMITTRSDWYTVYVLVQGWRDAGTNAAELVTERRAAMVVDRTGVISSGNQGLNVLTVPQD